jgi:hypothetical protein
MFNSFNSPLLIKAQNRCFLRDWSGTEYAITAATYWPILSAMDDKSDACVAIG